MAEPTQALRKAAHDSFAAALPAARGPPAEAGWPGCTCLHDVALLDGRVLEPAGLRAGKVLMALTSEQTRPHVHVLTPQGEVLLKIQVVLGVVACTALVNRVVSPEDLDPRVLRV